MPIDPAAFRHHPGLAGLIRDPETSFFRDFHPSQFDERMRALGRPDGWRRSDAEREATRAEALAGREGRDIWVFAYGSLMWDPAFLFDEVRRATLPGWQRCMVLWDRYGARGTPEAPGVMAALIEGSACEGVAFRIPAARADHETEILWRREMLGHAYIPRFLPADTAQGRIEVLAFTGDPTAEVIRPELTRDEIVRCVATGRGMLGSSREYLDGMLENFAELKVHDPDLHRLMAEVERFEQAHGIDPAGDATEEPLPPSP